MKYPMATSKEEVHLKFNSLNEELTTSSGMNVELQPHNQQEMFTATTISIRTVPYSNLGEQVVVF